MAIAKRYPPQTALCLREGWEFCKSDLAAESTFGFLVERWKDTLPSGYLVKEAYVDRPSEEAPCQCHFGLVQSYCYRSRISPEYQWSVADRSLSNFVPILDATKEVYWAKREDIGKILKIECTPVVGETDIHPYLPYLHQFSEVKAFFSYTIGHMDVFHILVPCTYPSTDVL